MGSNTQTFTKPRPSEGKSPRACTWQYGNTSDSSVQQSAARPSEASQTKRYSKAMTSEVMIWTVMTCCGMQDLHTGSQVVAAGRMFGDLAAGTVLAGVTVQLARLPGTAFTTCLSLFSLFATLIVSALRTR